MSLASIVAPATEAELAALVAAATASREPLAIEGNGSKRALLRPVQAARTLSTRNLAGITLARLHEKWFGEKPAADSSTATIAPGHGHPGSTGYDATPVTPKC